MSHHHKPAASDGTQPALSLVIPAYNELERLPPYLAEIRAYMPAAFADSYEVLVVDDGSHDRLAERLELESRDWPQLRVLRHEQNRGKGAAVRTGMCAAHGALRLFADADGATPIREEARLRAAITAGADVAIGSRLAPSADVRRRRTLGRALVGRTFAWLARRAVRAPVRDTQCGFKMFTATAAERLFARVEETRYLFDLELLMLAGQLGLRVAEVPIDWSDVPGSRMRMLGEARRIAAGLWRLRRRSKAPRAAQD